MTSVKIILKDLLCFLLIYKILYCSTVLGQLNAIPQGNNTVITWTPEYNPQCFIVDWGTGKEDMHMKIITKPVENFTLGNVNFLPLVVQ